MKPACEVCGRPDRVSQRQLACLDPPLTEWPDVMFFRSPFLCDRCRRSLIEMIREWPTVRQVVQAWPRLQKLLETQGVAA